MDDEFKSLRRAPVILGPGEGRPLGVPAMNPKSFLLVATLVVLAAPVLAQQAPGKPLSPEEMTKSVEARMGAMAPAMGAMAGAMIEAQMSAAARPETAQRLAMFKRNLYEALLKQGFNGPDALQITIATSPPGAALNAK